MHRNIHISNKNILKNDEIIKTINRKYLGKPPKKKVKKFHNKCEIRGGGSANFGV